MTTSDTRLSLKLLIDTKARKVLFAEAEKDCVDFLFHILTLPVGTVTRLLKEKGMNGCLPNLYDSVENMNDTYIQPNKHKDILLKPKSSIQIASIPLLLVNDVPAQKKSYVCPQCSYTRKFTHDPNVLCPSCRNCRMSCQLTYVDSVGVKEVVSATGGFVKEVVTYMVMDDLVIKPMSTISSITLLNKFNVKDVGVLQEQVVGFGMEEALKLLKASFESNTVLTNVFLSHLKAEK